jgi:hypothetical protein
MQLSLDMKKTAWAAFLPSSQLIIRIKQIQPLCQDLAGRQSAAKICLISFICCEANTSFPLVFSPTGKSNAVGQEDQPHARFTSSAKDYFGKQS